MTSTPKHVIIATGADTGEEAMHIDGDLVTSEETIYACDIAAAVGDGIIQLSHVLADWSEDWPDKYEALVPHLVAT